MWRGLQRLAAAEISKIRLSREFRGFAIFDFFNSIGQKLILRDSPLLADIVAKYFWGDERKFLEPLMRFTRGDARVHIDSSKIDHGPPQRR